MCVNVFVKLDCLALFILRSLFRDCLCFCCSLGGLVLDHTIVHFDGIAAFQPVINGRCILAVTEII